MEYKNLNHKSFSLNKEQLEQYFEKFASDQILKNKSDALTYPIPKVKENFEIIEEVYHLLNEHIKLKIPIHPAGEWLLDNFYIIEEIVKKIKEDMTLKKYIQFIGISNGQDAGFARVYVLAHEIVNYTDNHVNSKSVSNLISYYQKKKTLSMQEIWNIGTFMQIALVQNIRNICEKIYFSQMQKYRAENIIERLIEKKDELKFKNLGEYKAKVKGYGEMKYPFIEYLSYRLRKEGKAANPFIKVLEEQVNKIGTTIEDVIKKEHFDMATKKVEMANCIISMKEISRMDFLSIFENESGIEEVLKKDPANIYNYMDLKTKEEYRKAIEEISKKTKIAEIYIANTALKLANQEKDENKKSHIGYYLISKGKEQLYKELQQKNSKNITIEKKAKLYVFSIWTISIMIQILLILVIQSKIKNITISLLIGIFLLLPVQEMMVQIIQYILGKVVKPRLIPKMDLSNGVPEEAATFVVIPTIVKSKEKVAEMLEKLEIYYLANKSENLYFALLGDCSSGKNVIEEFDEEIIKEGLEKTKKLNHKYPNKENEIPKFHFIYRNRTWNSKEGCYLGWERKRGLLTQFNQYILGKEKNSFRVNTLEWHIGDVYFCAKYPNEKNSKLNNFNIKYVITLDADTELVLNSALELIGAMEHILNKPVLNENKDCVIDGHAILQPRIGITMEAANKNLFTRIFARSRRN